ncbi:MAG: DUF6677 family protein [Tepidisphaeraceae bacterium]|jgi:hypothetical protein
MPDQKSGRAVSPFLVGICAWLIPGWGYWLLGQRVRAITVCVTIVVLFLMGIAIGGIRVMDPPGWGEYGYMVQLVTHEYDDGQRLVERRVDPTSADEQANPAADNDDRVQGPAVIEQPLAELAERPWFAGQVLCGPITLIASDISIHAARPPATPDSSASAIGGQPVQEGVESSHSRSWEIGTLYTAVAGMLNLLTIIDAGFRASERKSQ